MRSPQNCYDEIRSQAGSNLTNEKEDTRDASAESPAFADNAEQLNFRYATRSQDRSTARRIRRGWRMVEKRRLSSAMAKRVPVCLVAQHALGNLIQNIELLAKAKSILSRRSSTLRNPWAETPSSHPRRRASVHTCNTCMYNRSRVISARVTLAERIVPLRGALKNKSNRRDGSDGDGDSGRLSIHRRYAISSGVTTTENDEDWAERNERNIPDGLYVRGCFR